MKKRLAFILVLASMFALCACGSTEVIEKEVTVEVPVVPEEYVKYQKVIDALEAGNYDGAQAIIEQMKPKAQPASPAPTPETPSVIEVQITTDNFLDYFELDKNPLFNKDSQGNTKDVYLYPRFILKSDYSLAFSPQYDSKVKIGIKYPVYRYNSKNLFDVDLDSLSFTAKGNPSGKEEVDTQLDGDACYIKNIYSYEINFPLLPYFILSKDSCSVINEEDIEIVSASGKLYLSNKG